MKRFLTLLSVLLAISACNTLSSAERAERDAKKAQAVEKALADRHYTIDIDMMLPSHGSPKRLTSDYNITVKGDTLVSYLPYMGRAYNVPYGGGNGFDFTAPIKEYKSEKGHKDKTQITIKVDNENDNLTYTLEVFSNGNASLNVISREREPINYNGTLNP